MVKLTKEEFVSRAKKVHGDEYGYDITEYGKNNNTLVKINCKIHGVFEQRPKKHLLGAGCRECKLISLRKLKTLTTTTFISKAISIHGKLYKYDNCIYINSRALVKIHCKKHGEYTQIPNAHLSGKGCQKCSNEFKKGFTKKDFIRKSKGKECIFYKIVCWNGEEKFYKIGITSRNVSKRFTTKKLMPYNYEVISEVKGEAGKI